MNKRLLSFVLLACLLIPFISGCAMLAKSALPTVLTTKEQMWIVPAGTKFYGSLTAKEPPKEFIAEEDLVILYKGNLLELEQEANRKAIKVAREAKKQGALWGGLGSLMAIIAGLVTKKGLGDIFGKPKK